MTQQQLIKNLQVPQGIVDVVLDTDAYNEIDDQFAIAYMLLSPERLRVKQLYAAPFHNKKSTSPEDGMERSYNEILKVLDLAGRGELKEQTYRGSRTYLPSETEPVESPAARALVELSKNYSADNPQYIIDQRNEDAHLQCAQKKFIFTRHFFYRKSLVNRDSFLCPIPDTSE